MTEKTITFSTRIEPEIYKVLQKESKDAGISYNALMHSILTNYSRWEKYAKQIGFLPMSHVALKEIFSVLDENEIKQIGEKVGLIIPREILDMNLKESTFENIKNFLDIIVGRFGAMRIEEDDHKTKITIQHKISKKFSVYIESIFISMAHDIGFHVETNSINVATVVMTIWA